MNKFFILILAIVFVPIYNKAQIVIDMEETGGVYQVPCKVNGIPMKFIFDTGASKVCISLSEALFMLKNGHLDKSDLKGTTYSQIANGDIVTGTIATLKTIEIGGLKLFNVEAIIDNSLTAPLLLGQSAIQKLGSIRLEKSKLIIYQNSSDAEGNSAFSTLFNQGVFAMNDNKLDEAITYFQKAIQIQPNAYAYCNIGNILIYKGDYKNALTNLQKAYSLDSEDPITTYNMADCYMRLNNDDRALEFFKTAITLATFIYKDNLAIREDCDIVVFNSLYHMGGIYQERGQRMDAIERYNQLLKVHPGDSKANFQLGEIYYNNKEYDKAYEHYMEAVKNDNTNLDNSIAYYKLGLLNLFQKKESIAIEMLNKCISFTRDNLTKRGGGRYLLNISLSKLHLARYYAKEVPAKSNELYEDIFSLPWIEFKPWDYCAMSRNYKLIGQDKKCETTIDSGLVKFPDNPDLLFVKTRENKQISPRESNHILERILKQEHSYKPTFFDYATVYNNIAWNYHLMGEPAKGLPYSRKSIELNSTHDYSWETLGELYYDTGDYKGCIAAMQQCLKISDKFKEEANRLIYLSKNKRTKGRRMRP